MLNLLPYYSFCYRLRTCTFTKMAQSYRHLFIGTTAGSVSFLTIFDTSLDQLNDMILDVL